VLAVYVPRPGLSDADRKLLEQGLAKSAKATARKWKLLEGEDPVETIVRYARSPWHQLFYYESSKASGHLKIYLGYAAGVGKTYRMLEEARDLKGRGVDVVLAFLEPQERGDLVERAKEFETVPLLRVACRGSHTEEMTFRLCCNVIPRCAS